MSKSFLCITGAQIASFDSDAAPMQGMDLWIADGKILAILPAGSAAPQSGAFDTIAFRKALVIPGLINAHTHSRSALMRGTTAGVPLDINLMEAMIRRVPQNLHLTRTAVLRLAMEMLKAGVTSVVDHFTMSGAPDTEAVSTALNAYGDIGVRAVLAPSYQDVPYIESLPIDLSALPADVVERWKAKKPPPPELYFEMMDDLVARWRGRSDLKILLGVEGPQRCTPRLLEMTGDFASRHGIGLHTHLLESKTQALMAPGRDGESFVAYLDRFGLINPRSSLAHFVWCNDRDIEVAADRGVSVVNNPFNNLHLGSGIQPTARLLAAGINVALGTDGTHGTNATLFEKARLSALLSRITELDNSKWIRARQALRMATVNGGAVMNEPGLLGTIRVGAHADLAIIDLTTPTYRPMGELMNHLVMYETGSSVDTVIVNGEIVVRHGRCTRISEEDVLGAADDAAAEIHAASAPMFESARTECALFEPAIRGALAQPMPIDRFAARDDARRN